MRDRGGKLAERGQPLAADELLLRRLEFVGALDDAALEGFIERLDLAMGEAQLRRAKLGLIGDQL